MAWYLLCLDDYKNLILDRLISRNKFKFARFVTLAVVVCLMLGQSLPSFSASDQKTIRLATTTSTENTGLLDYLLPHFKSQFDYSVHVVAVGTGKALRMGRDGDADLVLVHAPSAEQAFVDGGYGAKRIPIMYNDFVIVGPKSDNAGVKQASTIEDAMQALTESQSIFVSRADDSGTHKKEMDLWRAINVEPSGQYYREAGQGMGKVLTMAGELDGYTLVDRGTWLAYKGKSPLTLLFDGVPRLRNPYSIIAVNDVMHPHLNGSGARSLIDWMVGEQAQQLIGGYRINGEVLFVPDA